MNDRFRFRTPILEDDGKFLAFHYSNALEGVDNYRDVGPWVKGKLEQCTGIKDKNGNLIYENDIIEIIGNGGKKLHFRVAVSDRNGGYYFPAAPLGYSFDFLDRHLYEIVGNTNENPELLEDK